MLTRAAAALAVMVPSGSTGSGEPVEPAANEIVLVATADPEQPFAFEPAEFTVEVGTTVRWRNTTGDVFHTVTFTESLERRQDNGGFNHSLLAAGDFVEYTFAEPGAYAYFCQPHSEFMAGTITVTTPEERSTAWLWWAAWAAGSLVLVGLAVITSRRSSRTVTDR